MQSQTNHRGMSNCCKTLRARWFLGALAFDKADEGLWVHASCGSADSLVLSQGSPSPSSATWFLVHLLSFQHCWPKHCLGPPSRSHTVGTACCVSVCFSHPSCHYCWLESISDHFTPCFHTSFPRVMLLNCQSGHSIPLLKSQHASS